MSGQENVNRGREAYLKFLSTPTVLNQNEYGTMSAYVDYKIKKYGDKVGLYAQEGVTSRDQTIFMMGLIDSTTNVDKLRNELKLMWKVLQRSLASFMSYNLAVTNAMMSITKEKNDVMKAYNQKCRPKVLSSKTKEELIEVFRKAKADWETIRENELMRGGGRKMNKFSPEKEAIREVLLDSKSKLLQRYNFEVALPATVSGPPTAERTTRNSGYYASLTSPVLDFLEQDLLITDDKETSEDDDDEYQPSPKRARSKGAVGGADDDISDEEIRKLMRELNFPDN